MFWYLTKFSTLPLRHWRGQFTPSCSLYLKTRWGRLLRALAPAGSFAVQSSVEWSVATASQCRTEEHLPVWNAVTLPFPHPRFWQALPLFSAARHSRLIAEQSCRELVPEGLWFRAQPSPRAGFFVCLGLVFFKQVSPSNSFNSGTRLESLPIPAYLCCPRQR